MMDRLLDGITLIDLKRKNKTEIPGTIRSAGVSPDGKWLAYSMLKSNQFEIIVQSVNGAKSIEISRGLQATFSRKLHWIDSQSIWFPEEKNPQPALPIMVLNPFTMQQTLIQTDYPGIVAYMLGSGRIRFHFGYSSAVYDPSLNWAIYPEFDGKGNYYQTLWDRKTQKAVAKVKDDFGFGILPIWQESYKQFIVAGYPNSDAITKEWMAINLNGQIQQITHLGKMERNYKIQNNAVLSPDENTLAFTLEIQDKFSDSTESSHLVLLDLETGKFTDTCLSAENIAWSLNNQYLAVSTPKGENADNQISLIDLKEKRSYPLIEGVLIFPVGWMAQP
jgi:hypothetical protein